MDAETRRALESSIEHWKRMRDDPFGKDQPVGWQCALCSMFCGNASMEPCHGCPVMKATGVAHCEDTPYVRATDAFHMVNIARQRTNLTVELLAYWEANADMEIEFLQSLLPNEVTTEEKENQ